MIRCVQVSPPNNPHDAIERGWGGGKVWQAGKTITEEIWTLYEKKGKRIVRVHRLGQCKRKMRS